MTDQDEGLSRREFDSLPGDVKRMIRDIAQNLGNMAGISGEATCAFKISSTGLEIKVAKPGTDKWAYIKVNRGKEDLDA